LAIKKKEETERVRGKETGLRERAVVREIQIAKRN
jgi:hypothetical protein